jgi:glutathione peroxidase
VRLFPLSTPLLAALLIVLGTVAILAPPAFKAEPAAPDAAPASVLELEARRLGGDVEKLDRYRGQVLLIVNTASRCGYTPQYEGLQALYTEKKDAGLTVLGFPSNDFGGQEPGSDAQIGAFCKQNYGVDFPMFTKAKVTGPDAQPVYAYLTSQPEPVGGPVRWNFQKYLVARDGRVVERFSSSVSPTDARLRASIERLLAEPAPTS